MFCYISLRCGSIFYVQDFIPNVSRASFSEIFFSHRYNKTNFKFMIFVAMVNIFTLIGHCTIGLRGGCKGNKLFSPLFSVSIYHVIEYTERGFILILK